MSKEILVADSDRAVQEDFQAFLEPADYHLVFSENSDDALLRAKIFKPDLIFASTSLREKNGWDLCEAVKKDPEFKDVPFILISSIFEEISEEDRQRVHADGVVSKPIQQFEVLKMIERHLDGEASKKPRATSGWRWDESGESEEEIIELVDIIEEPEARMSISDFVAEPGQQSSAAGTTTDPWPELARPLGFLGNDELPPLDDKTMDLDLERNVTPKKVDSEEELFEKIELEEILKKVEEIKPAIEKEWGERGIEGFTPAVQASGEAGGYPGVRNFEMGPPAQPERSSEKFQDEPGFDFLGKEFLEEAKEPAVKRAPSEWKSIALEAEEEPLEEIREEPFPEELLEFVLQEKDLARSPESVEPRQELKIEAIREEKVPETWEESVTAPLQRGMDKRVEEVILKGVQEMTEDFITKVLPEMTQHIIGITVERIEKMVKEIVPEIAERAIQEEIKRLQEGEKH